MDKIYRHAVQAVSNETSAGHPTSIEFSNEGLVSLFSEAGLSVIPDLHQTRAGKQVISRDAIAVDGRIFGLSMDVLTRNRLIEENFRTQVLVNDKHVGAGNVFSLTDIGVAFVEACTAPKTRRI